MARKTYGAEEARSQLPQLLDRAHRGSSSVITKHGKPYAALVPIEVFRAQAGRRLSLLALKGSGAGLWGQSASRFVADLRDEWP